MVIEILNKKYRCGCERGMAEIKKPHILTDLNAIIEWKFCTFPDKIINPNYKPEFDESGKLKNPPVRGTDIAEDREFLGKNPELKPGNCFIVDGGQVIAVDSEDRLILIVSETGHGALDRIWKEKISPEMDMLFNDSDVENATFNLVTLQDIPEEYVKSVTPDFSRYKIWKERFIPGRTTDGPDFVLKVEVEHPDLLFPITIYMRHWSVLYNSEDFENSSMAKDIIDQTIDWFYMNCPRIKYEKPKSGSEMSKEKIVVK